MSTPKHFPGVNGNPMEGIPSFICLDGLPVEWQHMVTLSRPLSRAVNAASQLPLIEDEEVRANLLHELDLAEQATLNVVETVRRIRQWSMDNLETASSRPKSHGHSHEPSHSPKHGTKSHES